MKRLVRWVAFLLALEGAAFGEDLSGIWMGRAEKEDVAFQLRKVNGSLTGVWFGEEFDLPMESLKIEGDHVSFSVTSTNYYSGNRVPVTYTGVVAGREIRLTRERKDGKETFVVKRVG